jgi:tetratricopeptide (TPR) repeat protein
VLPDDDDEQADARAFMPVGDEPYAVAPRRRVGGWIVAFALMLAVAVVGWATLRPYLVGRETVSTAKLDAKAEGFLSVGERALGDGDWDVAQESFDKASAFAENDPRVLLDEAVLATARADVPWLTLRLLAPEAVDQRKTTQAQLDSLAGRARRFAEAAEAAAPSDIASMRAHIDALRLSGDRDGARAYVPKVIGRVSQPETAYALAVLDLADPQPPLATVIERLRLATAAAEGMAVRARAALVYALARSGDFAAARAELGKMEGLAHPSPLTPFLRSFIDRLDRSTLAPAADAAAPAVNEGGSSSPPQVRTAVGQAGSTAVDGLGSESRGGSVDSASAALKRGDAARAHAMYQAVLERNPNDSEALAGLGDVAKRRGDLAGAMSWYRRAIGSNPSYLPALLGLADCEWAAGQRSAAVRAYGDIVDRFPEGTYPAYVGKRAEAAGSAPAAETGSSAAPEHIE